MIFFVCVILEIRNEIEHFFMFIGHLCFFFHAFSVCLCPLFIFLLGYFFLIDL